MPRLASRRLIVFAVVTLVLGFPTFARAQKDAGSIVGTVKDPTRALVSNAKVTVTDVERGSTFSATTNDAGEYVVGPLRVGRYIVMVEHPGFKKAVSEPVNLDVKHLIGNVHATPCVPGTFFNTCAFGEPALGAFGNVRRNSVQGPGYQIWDFSLFKNLPISERTKLEFRAEFFNVFNHPNLQFAKSGPQNSINTTTFGTPQFGFLTAARDPRQIQLALKLSL
jgi:hypothetical protein